MTQPEFISMTLSAAIIANLVSVISLDGDTLPLAITRLCIHDTDESTSHRLICMRTFNHNYRFNRRAHTHTNTILTTHACTARTATRFERHRHVI